MPVNFLMQTARQQLEMQADQLTDEQGKTCLIRSLLLTSSALLKTAGSVMQGLPASLTAEETEQIYAGLTGAGSQFVQLCAGCGSLLDESMHAALDGQQQAITSLTEKRSVLQHDLEEAHNEIEQLEADLQKLEEQQAKYSRRKEKRKKLKEQNRNLKADLAELLRDPAAAEACLADLQAYCNDQIPRFESDCREKGIVQIDEFSAALMPLNNLAGALIRHLDGFFMAVALDQDSYQDTVEKRRQPGNGK